MTIPIATRRPTPSPKHARLGRGQPARLLGGGRLYERANGRLYVGADFAIPRGFSETNRSSSSGRLRRSSLPRNDSRTHSPSMPAATPKATSTTRTRISCSRSARTTGSGGAASNSFAARTASIPNAAARRRAARFTDGSGSSSARERWATLSNEALERAGRPERVDHRSYERQGIDREPGEHYGPGAADMVSRGRDHDGLENAARRVEEDQRLADLERELESISDASSATAGSGGRGMACPDDEEEERRRQPDRLASDRSSNDFPER